MKKEEIKKIKTETGLDADVLIKQQVLQKLSTVNTHKPSSIKHTKKSLFRQVVDVFKYCFKIFKK